MGASESLVAFQPMMMNSVFFRVDLRHSVSSSMQESKLLESTAK